MPIIAAKLHKACVFICWWENSFLVNTHDTWFAFLSVDLLCGSYVLLRSSSGGWVDVQRSQTTSSPVEDSQVEQLYSNKGLLFSILYVCFCSKVVGLNIWKAKTYSRGHIFLFVPLNLCLSRIHHVIVPLLSKTVFTICSLCPKTEKNGSMWQYSDASYTDNIMT